VFGRLLGVFVCVVVWFCDVLWWGVGVGVCCFGGFV
jgi:hypothetical protein